MNLFTSAFYLIDSSLQNIKLFTVNIMSLILKLIHGPNAQILLLSHTHLYVYALRHTSAYLLFFLTSSLETTSPHGLTQGWDITGSWTGTPSDSIPWIPQIMGSEIRKQLHRQQGKLSENWFRSRSREYCVLISKNIQPPRGHTSQTSTPGRFISYVPSASLWRPNPSHEHQDHALPGCSQPMMACDMNGKAVSLFLFQQPTLTWKQPAGPSLNFL